MIFKPNVISLYSYLCIYVSMYQWIYIATNLHTVDLDCLQAVLESNPRCTWRWQSSDLREANEGCAWGSLVMHWEPMIMQICKGDWRDFGQTLGGWDLVNVEMCSKAVLEPVWRCTRRPWTSGIREEPGGSRWEAHWVLMRLYSSVSQLATMGIWYGDFTNRLTWRAGWWQSSL